MEEQVCGTEVGNQDCCTKYLGLHLYCGKATRFSCWSCTAIFQLTLKHRNEQLNYVKTVRSLYFVTVTIRYYQLCKISFKFSINTISLSNVLNTAFQHSLKWKISPISTKDTQKTEKFLLRRILLLKMLKERGKILDFIWSLVLSKYNDLKAEKLLIKTEINDAAVICLKVPLLGDVWST